MAKTQEHSARVRETTHSRNREVAERIERERRRNLELGIQGLRPIEGPLNVGRAVDAYIEENQARWGKRTHQLHENSWRHLKPRFAGMLLHEIRPRHIGLYQREPVDQGASGRTVNIEVSLLRMVFRRHRGWERRLTEFLAAKPPRQAAVGRSLRVHHG